MVNQVLSVCIFCFICATHTPCGSHAAVDHESVRTLHDRVYGDPKATRVRFKEKPELGHVLQKRDAGDYLDRLFDMFGDGKTMTRDGFERFIARLDLLQVLFDKIDNLNGSAKQPVARYGDVKSNQTCINKEDILSTMTSGKQAPNPTVIDNEMLQKACPAILYALIVGGCDEETHVDFPDHDGRPFLSTGVWLYSLTAVVVTSACGVLALVIIPLMQKKFYKPLLQFLVALAVGTLAGDALLHLLPHAMSGNFPHRHDHGLFVGSADDRHDENTWKGFVSMVGLSIFFFMERMILFAGRWRKQRHKIETHSNMKIYQNGVEDLNEPEGTQCMDRYNPYPYCYRDILNHQLNNCNDPDKTQSTVVDELDGAVEYSKKSKTVPKMTEDNQNMTACPAENLSACSEVNKMLPANKDAAGRNADQNITIILREHGAAHHGHSHNHGHVHAAPQDFKAVAWMVIMGDGLHNFTDGMAIGAAFSGSFAGGFSTAVAVFCHELPHELGDFAMLLKAGMTTRQALFYNLLSSVLSLLGNIVGIFLGNTESASSWVFALAAGIFLYIALVDMLPELSSSHEDENNLTQVCLHMSGLISGFGIMTLIAFYEHDLKMLFKDPF